MGFLEISLDHPFVILLPHGVAELPVVAVDLNSRKRLIARHQVHSVDIVAGVAGGADRAHNLFEECSYSLFRQGLPFWQSHALNPQWTRA